MEPILNKSEIASLLKAIREGRVSLELEEKQQTKVVDAVPANLFQLTRHDNKQFRIPNFDIILDLFTRSYTTSLSNQLQRSLSITRTGLASFEFQKFMADKTNLGAIGILDMNPLKYGAMIILDSVLSFSVLEIMLGASSELPTLRLDRKLTTLELTILKGILSEACADLNKAFAQLLDMRSILVKLENNARLVSIVEPEAEVIVGTFLMKIGEFSGEMHLLFPFATLEPLKDALRELLNIPTITRSSWQSVLETEVLDVPASVTALSGYMTLTINQILKLQTGDVINLDYDPNSPLKVLVEDQLKFSAIPGTHNGKKAISLISVHHS